MRVRRRIVTLESFVGGRSDRVVSMVILLAARVRLLAILLISILVHAVVIVMIPGRLVRLGTLLWLMILLPLRWLCIGLMRMVLGGLPILRMFRWVNCGRSMRVFVMLVACMMVSLVRMILMLVRSLGIIMSL